MEKKRYRYKEREDGTYFPLSVPSDALFLLFSVFSASSNQLLLVLSLLSHSLFLRERTLTGHCLPILLTLYLLVLRLLPRQFGRL
jgi:hypothetical protein